MFVAILENQPVSLIPLADALDQTGISQTELNGFTAGHFPTHAVWEDKAIGTRLHDKLIQSIPLNLDVDELLQLPDQLAILLRTELTLLSTTYDFSADEKDLFEQQLQNVLRPIVYACIEKIVGNEEAAQPEKLIGRLLGETIAIGWQTHAANGWEIEELESVLGPVGYRFTKRDQVIVAEGNVSAEFRFFLEMGQLFATKLSSLKR